MDTPRKYGWHPDLPDLRDFKMAYSPTKVKALPPKVDLRLEMPPIFDQGILGPCTAHATAAQVWHKDKTFPFEPSRLFIYYNTRVLEGTVKQDSGASIRNSIKSVVKWGFAKEEEWPYVINNFRKKPPANAYKTALTEKVASYSKIAQRPDQIKAALADNCTVNFGFGVYESFEGGEVAKTGNMAMPGKDERMIGGHAVLIVGYDDTISRYIVRNSWGPTWGAEGYFFMPYEYVHNSRLATDFWVVRAVP